VSTQPEMHIRWKQDSPFTDLFLALKDIASGAAQYRIWIELAVEDIRSRYLRSFIGIGWVFVSFAFFVLVKIIIFAPLSGKSLEFFAPYVTVGFFVWTFISYSMAEGSTTFISAKNWIKGSRIPLSVFAYRSVLRNTILTLINGIVAFLIIAYFHRTISTTAFIALGMFMVMLLNAIWVMFFLGALGARYQDFVHLVSTIMRIMLFLTPIFWIPEQMGALWDRVLIFNPFAHFLISIRDPLLYDSVPMLSITVVGVISGVGLTASLLLFSVARRRIPFWV